MNKKLEWMHLKEIIEEYLLSDIFFTNKKYVFKIISLICWKTVCFVVVTVLADRLEEWNHEKIWIWEETDGLEGILI